MPRIVGFIFGAVAGLLAAAWLYGGSTWGPGFAAKEASQELDAPQFKLSSEQPPVAAPSPPRKAPDESAPASAETPSAPPAPAFNTGGNPSIDVAAGPNWGLGFGLGRTTTGSADKSGDANRVK
jgi:hypothetical protein